MRGPAEPGLKMKGSPLPAADASPEVPPLPVTRRTMGPPVDPGNVAPKRTSLTPGESQPGGRRRNAEWPSSIALVSNASDLRHLAPIHRIPLPMPSQIGPYNVLEEIGSGGMAVVYKAVQPSLDRLVAIKVLRPGVPARSGRLPTRFESAKPRRWRALQHGNLVHVYDFARLTPTARTS